MPAAALACTPEVRGVPGITCRLSAFTALHVVQVADVSKVLGLPGQLSVLYAWRPAAPSAAARCAATPAHVYATFLQQPGSHSHQSRGSESSPQAGFMQHLEVLL